MRTLHITTCGCSTHVAIAAQRCWPPAQICASVAEWRLHGDGRRRCMHIERHVSWPSRDSPVHRQNMIPPACGPRCFTLDAEHVLQRIVIPRETIWLNGPPGSGKGANLGFVKRIRGLSRSVTMSGLLERNPEAQAIIREGALPAVPATYLCAHSTGMLFHVDYTVMCSGAP